jgi:hypothetical protein
VRYGVLRGAINLPLDSLTLAEFKEIVNQREVRLLGDYVRTIENWKSFFPEEQLFIGFYEDISQRPKQLLLRVFEFLRVEPSQEYVTQLAFEKVNPSLHTEMPPGFRLYLANQYYPQVKALSEMIGGYVVQWQRELERILQ